MELKTKLKVARSGQAYDKWREYKDAYQKSKDKMHLEMAQAFFQIRKGMDVIEIGAAIRAGGTHAEKAKPYWPKLAIAHHTVRMCYYHFFVNGTAVYCNSNWVEHSRHRRGEWNKAITIPNCFAPLERHWFAGERPHDIRLKAPVPMIPPDVKPKLMSPNHFILWEVETWEETQMPEDPVLLRRIGEHFFVAEAHWELTDVERAAMSVLLH
jgi:hypothetical protein